MPVFNESESIITVVEEWTQAIERLHIPYIFWAFNDGSMDDTGQKLLELSKRFTKLRVVNKSNSGHGQTCLQGYITALAEGAEWVLQIDSDGQCDPKYLEKFWSIRKKSQIIYGRRKIRLDGRYRKFVSLILKIVVFLSSGSIIPDSNVPYRLMHRSCFGNWLGKIPSDFNLINVLIAVIQQMLFGIHWIDIVFRKRYGGTVSVKAAGFFRAGIDLYLSLNKCSDLWVQRS